MAEFLRPRLSVRLKMEVSIEGVQSCSISLISIGSVWRKVWSFWISLVSL